MKILFFDIQITGHHSEYIGHIIDYLVSNGCGTDTYFFVVHPEFEDKFPLICKKTVALSNFHWILCTYEEFYNCGNVSAFKNSFTSLRLVNKYAKKLQADHVCLLLFNIFQLGLIFCRTSYTVSGILFLQFYRMEKKQLKDKIKYYRKYLTTKLLTFNPKIKRVFILNDDKTVCYLNKEFKTSIFEMLPDPIPVLTPLPYFDIYEHYNIERHRKIFLHIGALGNRKGTFEVVESAQEIPIEKQHETAILLVGKIDEPEREQYLLESIEKSQQNSQVTLLWDNQFVSSEMMKSLFEQCYVILIPYKNAEASSGILGHAAAANKLVIATKSGLLEEIVNDNQLGILVEKVDSTHIAWAIEKSKYCQTNQQLSKKFLESHTAVSFAKKFLTD